jgi:hypothetical protein
MGHATIATYSEAGAVLPDAELVWNQDLDAWSFSKDGNGSKIFYSNVFPTSSDLPSASTYHGMFAHVHDTGRGYFAHGGVWKELFDTSAGQTVTGNIDVSAGSALKVADSSGIKINNIDLGNYSSFENALNDQIVEPTPSVYGEGTTLSQDGYYSTRKYRFDFTGIYGEGTTVSIATSQVSSDISIDGTSITINLQNNKYSDLVSFASTTEGVSVSVDALSSPSDPTDMLISLNRTPLTSA